MEPVFIIGVIAFGLLARWLHKRAEPPPQTHSAAKRGAGHDPKRVAGSGSEGQGIG